MKINTDVLPVLVLLWSSWLHIKGTRISGKKIKWQHSGCYLTAREKHWLEIECIPNNCLEMLYFLNNYFMKVEKRDCRYKQLYQILLVNLIPSNSRVNSHSFDTKFHCCNPMVTKLSPIIDNQLRQFLHNLHLHTSSCTCTCTCTVQYDFSMKQQYCYSNSFKRGLEITEAVCCHKTNYVTWQRKLSFTRSIIIIIRIHRECCWTKILTQT